jgi:hypothetical protein
MTPDGAGGTAGGGVRRTVAPVDLRTGGVSLEQIDEVEQL